MLTDNDDNLLQRALDGDLTPAEEAQLHARIAADRALGERAAQFRELAGVLDDLNEVDVPTGMVEDVMAGVTTRKTRRPAAASGGTAMARKIMWGLAAAAAVVLLVFVVRGFPPVDNAQATIGAAKRYQAPQIADKDVKLGDTSAQEFLQSDTFAKLIKDPAAVKLLSDASFRESLASQNVKSVLLNQQAREGLKVEAVSSALAKYGLACPGCLAIAASLAENNLLHRFEDAQVIAAVQAEAISTAVKSQNISAALNAQNVQMALKRVEAAACGGGCSAAAKSMLRNTELLTAVQSAAFVRMVQDAGLKKVLENSAVHASLKMNIGAALASEAFLKALADGRLSEALNSPAVHAALNANGFWASVSSAAFAQQLSAELASR